VTVVAVSGVIYCACDNWQATHKGGWHLMVDEFFGIMQGELAELEGCGWDVDFKFFLVVIKSCRRSNPRCPDLQCQRRSSFCAAVIMTLSLLRTEVDESEQESFGGAFAVMVGSFVLESIVH
jgi:hypothetical protein